MKEDTVNRITALEERIAALEQQLANVQNADTVKFNQVECHEIRVVSDDGIPFITMNYHDEETESPSIKVLDKTGHPLVYITAYENGGAIAVSPYPGTNPRDEVGIQMYIEDDRCGHIAVNAPDGSNGVILSVDPPSRGGAGRVAICGAIDNLERVVIGCDPETDNGSIKTYTGISMETDSLGNEPSILKVIGYPVGSRRHLEYQQYVLKQINEKLQCLTDEDQIYILNVKKETISRFLSQTTENVQP